VVPSEEMVVRLELLEQELAVCRLDGDSPVPTWIAGEITSLTRRRSELSVVCAAAAVPDEVTQQGPFRAVAVAGRLEFDQVGVLHALTGPLADAEIPILAFSTYETDLVLVPSDQVDAAVDALSDAGHDIVDA
jgi:uncharacterized protein